MAAEKAVMVKEPKSHRCHRSSCNLLCNQTTRSAMSARLIGCRLAGTTVTDNTPEVLANG